MIIAGCIAGVLSVSALLTPLAQTAESRSPQLASDETIIVFPSRAVCERDGASAEWVIRVRGWVFEREEDSAWRNAAIDKLGEEMGLTEDEIESDRFRGRARAFLSDNERGKRVEIKVAGRTFVMPETSEDGHFVGEIRLTEAELVDAAGDPGENMPRRLVPEIVNGGQAELIVEPIWINDRATTLVVCDIDDTIKVSNIGDLDNMLRAALVEPYVAVPGMSELLGKLAAASKERVEFHYLSASPWQLYEPLAAFLRENNFPAGSITLREFRLKDERVLNLFQKPTEYKFAELARLAAEMPDRRFILIGDSTEHDAELYVRFAKENPGRVVLIMIRGTPGDKVGNDRAKDVLKGMPGGARLVYFEDPATARLDIPELRQPGHEPPR